MILLKESLRSNRTIWVYSTIDEDHFLATDEDIRDIDAEEEEQVEIIQCEHEKNKHSDVWRTNQVLNLMLQNDQGNHC